MRLEPPTRGYSPTRYRSSLRITYMRILACMSLFPTPALRNTSHVLTLSVYGILNFLLRNQCSAASKFVIISLFNVHTSHPYNRVDQIYHFSILSRTGILMFLSDNTFFIYVNALFHRRIAHVAVLQNNESRLS